MPFKRILFVSALVAGTLSPVLVLATSSCLGNQVTLNKADGTSALIVGSGSTISCVDIQGGSATNLGLGVMGISVQGTITNNLEISSPYIFQGASSVYGISIASSGTVGSLIVDSAGSINLNPTGSGGALSGIYNRGAIGSVDNYGSIGGLSTGSSTSSFLTGIYLSESGTIGTIFNRAGATIYGLGRSAIDIDGGSVTHPVVTAINNSGSIIGGTSAGTPDSFAPYATTAGAITNTAGVIGNGTAGTGIINNAGAVITGGQYASGISNRTFQGWNAPGGTIDSILNNGTISTTSTNATYAGISNYGSTINTITNNGTISSAVGYGIKNAGVVMGVIGTINNAQGAGNIAGPLTYSGGLPANYNIIINSASSFGRLSATLVSGALNFGIYSDSNVTTGVYSQVLSGLVAGNISGDLTGSFAGGYSYSLALESGRTNIWDLTITRPTASVNSGSTSSLSSLSDAANISVAGGTLQANTGNSVIASTVHLTGSSATTIDSSGNSATFSSAITSTDQGRLVISDTGAGGRVTLNSSGNSIAGGVAVTGGTLAVGDVNNSSASLTADVAVSNAATLIGHGTISGAVTNNGGVVKPGGSIGTLSINGNYTQNIGSTLAIEINPTQNSLLAVSGSSGSATLGGGLQIIATAGVYGAKKYTILSATGGVIGSFVSLSSNLTNYSSLASYVSYDINNVYYTILPFSLVDTQQSIVNTASVLQNTFTLQNSILANSFSYDCNEFGINNVCISVGGRNTAVSAANGLNNSSALLIAAYRPHSNYRIGAYADQNLSVSNPGGTVNLGNNTPLIGIFGAWNERLDGTGAEIKVSAAYGQKNTAITRSVVGTSEPGSGSSQLNSQGTQVTAKYGFALTPAVIVSPYVGMRYTQNNMNGYTESTSAAVTTPLTYNALNTNSTTALAGVGASYRVTPVVTTFVSAGVEADTNTANGSYYGTNPTLPGLTPVNFNANPVRTRPTATLGAYYDVAKNQRLGVTGIYRQEAYQAVSTTTVLATYTVGM